MKRKDLRGEGAVLDLIPPHDLGQFPLELLKIGLLILPLQLHLLQQLLDGLS